MRRRDTWFSQPSGMLAGFSTWVDDLSSIARSV
jgi:hypothetical protein